MAIQYPAALASFLASDSLTADFVSDLNVVQCRAVSTFHFTQHLVLMVNLFPVQPFPL
jgi:hypothetical protein